MQHMKNKIWLQENINNLQKQPLEKDEIIRSLIETQPVLINIKIPENKSEVTKRDSESIKCEQQ